VLYGLVAAFGWGLSDFFGAVVGRRIGSLATVLVAQASSAILVTVVLLGGNHDVGAAAPYAGWIVLNGIVSAAAYASHYRALELGPVAVVSPIGACYALVGVVLSMVILGERPSALTLLGGLATVVGVMLTSTDLPKLWAGTHGRPPGLPWAIAAAIGFGIAAYTLGRAAQLVGWERGLWASRVAQVACFVPFALLRRRELVGLAVLTGTADLLGVVTYSIGSEVGYLSIVLAASAIFPALAVAGSVAFLGERPVVNQYVGVAVVAVGLLLLGLS
jgi:uncharacterized membrane protein